MTKLQLWLYMKWSELSAKIDRYFQDIQRAYLNAQAIKYANDFLTNKFRSWKDYNSDGVYAPKGAQKRRQPNPNCKHLKGNRLNRSKDYNLHAHTFPDSRTKIWCGNNCGFYLWNHEKGFQKAMSVMMSQSSNTPSSSERIARVISPKAVVVYQDKI